MLRQRELPGQNLTSTNRLVWSKFSRRQQFQSSFSD